MGIESSTTIQGLDASWPLSGDRRSEGDDHLRLIKSVLKAAFPGASGSGFNVPITAKEADLNVAFTTGVKTVFYMATAPTGWTLANPGTTYTLVSAATGGWVNGGAGRGDNIVTGCTVVPDHSHGQQGTFSTGTMSVNNTHSHSLTQSVPITAFYNGTGSGTVSDAIRQFGGSSTMSSADINHTHAVTISGQTSSVNFALGATTTTGTWQPLFAAIIIASRN